MTGRYIFAPMRLLIKYPTRQRPEQFAKTLAAYHDNLGDPVNTRFLITVDRNDRTMAGTWRNEIFLAMKCGVGLDIHHGKGKIAAINSGMEHAGEWDIVLLASDDMIPLGPRYDGAIRDAMRTYFPDTDGALWIHDGRQDRICTIVCMGRKYYDRFGYIYHPSYRSLWCDNEWTEVAQALGKIERLPELIRNESPDWQGNQKMDRLYRTNNQYYRVDERNYNHRKAAGFP